MGQKSNLNRFHKEEQKKTEREKLLSQPGMEVFDHLQTFYKMHPNATAAVAMEVAKIREESEQFSESLQKKFESEQSLLTVEFMKKELDYIVSYLSPDDKAEFEKAIGVSVAPMVASPSQGYDFPSSHFPKEPKTGITKLIKSFLP